MAKERAIQIAQEEYDRRPHRLGLRVIDVEVSGVLEVSVTFADGSKGSIMGLIAQRIKQALQDLPSRDS